MKHDRMRYGTALLAVMACGLVRPAQAQDGALMQAMRTNCVFDYMRFCAGLKTDGPEVKTCFRVNRAKLLNSCSQAIAAYERAESQER